MGDLVFVQEIRGHTDIAITAKFYTGATVEDIRAATEEIVEACADARTAGAERERRRTMIRSGYSEAAATSPL